MLGVSEKELPQRKVRHFARSRFIEFIGSHLCRVCLQEKRRGGALSISGYIYKSQFSMLFRADAMGSKLSSRLVEDGKSNSCTLLVTNSESDHGSLQDVPGRISSLRFVEIFSLQLQRLFVERAKKLLYLSSHFIDLD